MEIPNVGVLGPAHRVEFQVVLGLFPLVHGFADATPELVFASEGFEGNLVEVVLPILFGHYIAYYNCVMKSPHPLARFFFCKAVRKQIVPESITVEPF